jgi:hypothetical protein
MAPNIGQILAVSYPAVLAEMRKPANQWVENAFLDELERKGAIKRMSFGEKIQVPLDYKRNPNGGFFSTDLEPTSLDKTEVIDAAEYSIAQLGFPVTWSKMDEVKNPTENQKVALVRSLLENGINSHDDVIEEALFGSTTSGFLGLQTHIPTSGQGSDGGIDAAVETFWRPVEATYVDDTDIEAGMTTVWNACAKGSGSKLAPSLIVSDGATQALFEGTQQALQRWESSMNAGFKNLKIKSADYIFSQYGDTKLYFLNPKNFKVCVSREYFRDRGETQEIQNAHGFTTKLYSALQSVTDNRSRLGVLHT